MYSRYAESRGFSTEPLSVGEESAMLMPRVQGLSFRQALEALAPLDLEVHIAKDDRAAVALGQALHGQHHAAAVGRLGIFRQLLQRIQPGLVGSHGPERIAGRHFARWPHLPFQGLLSTAGGP